MKSNIKDSNEKNFIKNWIFPLAISFIIAMLINKFLIFRVYVPSESMAPTINKDDQFMATRIYNTSKIKRGDIVIFWSNELDTMLIKRVIGLPEDHIIIEKGRVNINGEEISECYVNNNIEYSGEFNVPTNKFFFLGDNRGNSNDSRMWIDPYIDKDNIRGKTLFRCYPFNKIGPVN